MTDPLKDALDGKRPKHPRIVLDRSRLEVKGTCPHQGTLAEEHKRPLQAKLPTIGSIEHNLIEESIEAMRGQGADAIADYYVNELPKQRPDMQPELLQAGKYVAKELLYLNPMMITGCELQIEYQILPAITKSRGPIFITMCLDLLITGRDDSLIVIDWKSGYKKRTDLEAFQSIQAQCAALILWKQKIYEHVDNIVFIYKETRWGTWAKAEFNRNKGYGYYLPDLTQEGAFETRLLECVRLILDGNDETWPDPDKCAWCDYSDLCKDCNIAAMNFAKDREAYVKSTIVIEEVLKKRKALMKTYILEGGKLDFDCVVARKKEPKKTFTLECVGKKKK